MRGEAAVRQEIGGGRWRGRSRSVVGHCSGGRPPLPPTMLARRHAAGLDYAPSDLELSLLRISSGSVCPSAFSSLSCVVC